MEEPHRDRNRTYGSIQQDSGSNDGQTSEKNGEDGEAVTTTARKLDKVLNTAGAQEPHEESTTGQQRYLSPTKIAVIFRGTISPANHCQISQLKHG